MAASGLRIRDHSVTRIPQTWSIRDIESFCTTRGLSLTATINAVWAVVLWEYTATENITFPSLNALETTDTWSQVGSLIDLTATFSQILRQIEDTAKVLEKAPSSSPASQSSSLLNTATVIKKGDSSSTVSLDPSFLVKLVCQVTATRLAAAIHFTPSSVQQAEADRLAAAFAHTLDLVLSSADKGLGDVDLVSDHDKSELFVWNKDQVPETINNCAHVLFQSQVAAQPEALAVEAWDGSFTYAELDRLSNIIAHYLVSIGVGPEISVPLCFSKSCWAIAALLGVIKAGGAMVFIDPANPPSRRQDIIEQIGSEFVLTDSNNAASWEELGIEPMIINKEFIDTQRDYPTPPISGVTPNNLLYVIFTSGTTGKPKGCLITHKAFLSGATQHSKKSNLNRDSRVMQLASYSFDVSVLEILTSLISGACVCTPDSAAMTQGLASIINGYRISWAFLTPSLVKLVKPHEVPTLKTLCLGGEPLHKVDLETWGDHLQLVNGYGPSECSIAAAADPNVKADGHPQNIGKAIGGLIWIVEADNHDKLVPNGGVGELLISGPILARGYLNNQEQTDQVFISDPLWCKEYGPGIPGGRRFYKTGDLARFNSDGTIFFIGRKDTQVKLRGLRIELGEIETNAAKHDYLKHVVVFLPKTGPCKEKLVAVLTMHGLSSEGTPGLTEPPIDLINTDQARSMMEEVRVHVTKCVPEYMVPTVWITLEAWPLLASAKLNRKFVAKWLQEMSDDVYRDIVGIEAGEGDVSEISDIEGQLREIFSTVLNLSIDFVTLNKSFLGLGGDSITAMQVMAQCRALGLSIGVKDILRSKTIPELAACVGQVTDSEYDIEEKFDHPFQMSPVQRYYCSMLPEDFEQQTENHFNQSFYLRLTKETSAEALKSGLDAVVSRHSMLRARWSKGDEGWTQMVLSQTEDSYRFETHKLSVIRQAGPIAATAQRSLSLNGPVFSADLMELGDQQYLFMTAHHAIIDWVSWRIVLRDLESFLTAGTILEQEPIPFQNWINLQAENAVEHGDPENVLPFDVPQPRFDYWNMDGKSNKISETREEVLKFDKEITNLLLSDQPHKALRTETLDFLLTTLLYSFSQVFSDRDLPAIFREGHGREPWDPALDISGTVGWFTTMYPLAVEAASPADLVDMLKRAKDIRHAVPDNGRPYFASRHHNELGMEKFRHHKQIEVSFDYLGQFQALDRSDALLRMEPRPSFIPQSDDVGKNLERFSLFEITGEVIQGCLQFSFVYNKHMRHQDKILSWIKATGETLADLINKMIPAPVDYTLSDFPQLALTYGGLEKLKDSLSFTDFEAVEDIYPCSPMQQGLLVSQVLSAEGVYEYGHVMKVSSRTPGQPIDAKRFADAWTQVVQRHSSLRTIFIESAAKDGVFDQLVFKSVKPDVTIVECAAEEAQGVFKKQEPLTFRSRTPPLRMTICTVGENELVCQLEINHALIDGGSIANILNDLLEAYESRLPAQPGFKFGDYIQFIENTDSGAALDFWKGYLEDQALCYFPKLAGITSPADEKETNVIEFDISVSVADIKKFCEQVNVTPVNVFQTAWAMVLKIFTESDDVCFGFLSSGRDAPLAGIDTGVGAFLTMLVCRLNLQADVTLANAVSQVAEDFIKSLPHQFYGLANIQHALGMSGSPLFNTIISFGREDTFTDEKQEGVSIESVSNRDLTEYALALEIGLSATRIKATIQHWTDYLTIEQIHSISSTFNKALDNLIRHSDQTIGQMELVGDHHVDKYIEFNGDEIPTSERLVFSDIAYNARLQPDAEAICSWDGSWTYKELDEVTNRLGHHLRSLGVGPETIVPHCFNKSAWAVITIVSIMKAGGAFVGFDPAHPRSRLEGLMEEVNASLVCASPTTAHVFKDMPQVKKLVIIDPEFVKALPKRVGRPCPEVKPENLACIVFSSGTTGKPKAIAMQHNSLSTFADQVAPALKVDSKSRVFQFAAFTFDISNQDIVITLQRGGCVCVPSDEDRINDPAGAIERLRANTVNMTSTVLSLILPEKVPNLKRIYVGGEPLAREVLNTWAPKVEMFNSYGPAETCIYCTTNGPVTPTTSTFNLGRTYGCWVWVVDPADYNRLMPLGAVGELLIEGPMLARHYLNNPSQTEKAFVSNPTWAQAIFPGQDRRFYRSGDICRMNADGNIITIGRRDAQVKINGQRVQLEEIKFQVQSQISRPAQVLVEAIQLPSHSRGKTLVAFISYKDSAPPSSDDGLLLPVNDDLGAEHAKLQRALQQRLPGYMIPAMYVPIVEIPRTRNGKLDRKCLQEMVLSISEEEISRYMLQHGSEKVMPQTPAEETLQALWSQVLNLPTQSIGTNDDFFRLGGDSVIAMKLVAAARTTYNLHLTVPSIFKHPELSDMAQILEQSGSEGGANTLITTSEPFDLLSVEPETLGSIKEEAAAQCGVDIDEIVDLYPCTPLQEGLLALSNRFQGGAYIGQRVLRITDEAFDYEAFKDAWRQVAASEAILRTRIVNTEAAGTLQAVIDQELEFVESDEDLDTYLKKDIGTPIRYGGALIRLSFVINSDGSYFVWTAHHAVYDGWSAGVLFERVTNALAHGVVNPSVSFRSFIAHLAQTDEQAANDFWEAQFSSQNGQESAVSYPEVSLGYKSNSDKSLHSRFSSKVVRPEGTNLTLAVILRAAWAMTIAQYRQTSNIVFAVTLSGRNAAVEGISEMVGPCNTTVPVRIDFKQDETTVEQYLAAVQEQSNEMMAFEQTGLQNIRRCSEAAKAAVDCIASLFLVQAEATKSDDCFTGMESVPNELEDFDTYPLVVQCSLGDDGSVEAEAKFDESVIPAGQMRRILDQYEYTVQQLCSKPSTLLSKLSAVSPQDVADIQKWNGPLPETINNCIHEVFAQRVKEQPNAQAICAWDGEFTYGELAKLSDKLAHHLQSKLNVRPDAKVGLCFDKSKWYAVALLAVMKVGGIYTGLSPTSPIAMLQGVISDLGANLVLCSPQHTSMLRGLAPKIVALDQTLMQGLSAPIGPIRSRTQPSSPISIVFTSGSTGKPKGVIMTHSGLCSMEEHEGPIIRVSKDTRLFQFASHNFDVPNFDYFATLMRGGTVCVPSEEERLNDLGGAINKYGANCIVIVPTAATVINPEDVPTLKTMILGGEQVPFELHERWASRIKLINSYGPAECHICVAGLQLLPESRPNTMGVGYGCRAWIVDENDHNRLMPIGCVGELCVEGPILTRGYHNNAVITARSYINNPGFAQELGISDMRMYKTGDLAVYNADGTLNCLGRIDSQIKLRGQRIECSEVEHHVSLNGFAIDEIAVELVYEGGQKDKPVLAAFVKVPAEEGDPCTLALPMTGQRKNRLIELRHNLANSIQRYMVPSLFIPVSRIPLGGTGKKDRKTLRATVADLAVEKLEEYYIIDADTEDVQEDVSTNNEVLLQSLWAEVLGISVDNIFANDHFLQKGGDSIRAIRLVSACRRNNKIITVGDMFSHPRLSDMAKCLRNEGASDAQETEAFSLVEADKAIELAVQQCKVDKNDIEDIYPCTPLQEGLMAISTRSPKAYVSVRVFDIPQTMDLVKFKAAWMQAAQLLPILRTKVIVDDDSVALQVVVKEELKFEDIEGDIDTYLANHGLSNIHYGGPLTACAMSSESRKFVWMAHHAVYDGVSANILFGLIKTLYLGEPVPAVSGYNKFIEYIHSIDDEDSNEFWREKLGGGAPTTFPQLPSASYKPRPDSELIYSFNMKHEASSGFLKATILRAAWAILIAKYTESDDVVFGETLSGRNVPVVGIEDLMGPCITTMPIRMRLDNERAVTDFLNEVQQSSADMIPFQHKGIQALRRLGPEFKSALEFQNLFVIQESSGKPEGEPFLTEVHDAELLQGFFDSYAMVMECVIEDNGIITVEARFDQNVLKPWQVKTLTNQFKHVINQLCGAESNTALKSIEILSPDDVSTIKAWNGEDSLNFVRSTVVDKFAEQVWFRADEIAISGWDGEMTYEQLDETSDKLARALICKGVKPETIVPVCFEKSKWDIVAVLAIMKAGGAVSQLGPNHPLSRKQEILEQTDARFALASREQADSLKTLIDVLIIDELSMERIPAFKDVVLPRVRPSMAAYVLFTSGSTGRSKGIVVEHRNLCTSSYAHGVDFKINPGTRVFQFAAYTFDVSCADIFTVLQRGATICIPSEQERVDDLAGAITKYNANWVFLTPTVAGLLNPDNTPTLRTLVLGGEAPTRENVETWATRLDLLLVWGPAETTIYASSNPPATLESNPARLGRAIGCRMWLCDPEDHNKLTPVGCVGEILVEGGIVSRGYLKDQEKTDAAYIENPDWIVLDDTNNTGSPRRFYKTGDLARYDADGVMCYVSRKDNQVKLRGQRLELGEIEHRILAHKGVRHAVTRIPRVGPLKDKLIAILSFQSIPMPADVDPSNPRILEEDERQTVGAEFAEIVDGIETSLPSYMVPSLWISVESVPLNMNGKIDRKMVNMWLEGMEQTTYEDLMKQGSFEKEKMLASTKEEGTIQELVRDVLNVTEPDLGRSFLSLGGDSITAMQLRTKARAQGMLMSVQDILKSKSLAELAAAVKTDKASRRADYKEEVNVPFDVSPIQSLFFDTAKTRTHFNQNFLLKVNRRVTAAQMEKAIEIVVARHSMLRSRYHKNNNGEWQQSISDKVQDSFDFRADKVKDRKQVGEILAKRKDLNMNIENGPLFIVHLFDLPTEGQWIFLSAHHLVIDLVSWRIIMGDIEEFLRSGAVNSETPVPFQAWLRLQKEHVASLAIDYVLPFKVPAARFDYWGMDQKSNVYGDILKKEFELDESVTTQLFGPANDALSTEPNDIILAAIFHSFNSVFSDRGLPAIHSEGHGREAWDEDINPDATVGWFTTITPTYVGTASKDIIDTVRLTKDLRRKVPNHGMPYFARRYLTAEGKEAFGRDPRIEILFNYLGKYQQLESKEALFTEIPDMDKNIAPSEIDKNLERFGLIDISAVVTHGKVKFEFAYNKHMRHQHKIWQWITTAQKTLKQAAESLKLAEKQKTVSDFPMLAGLDNSKLTTLSRSLASAGIAMGDVEDIYPTAPIQQRMLSAQKRQPNQGLYEVEISQSILPAGSPNATVDVEKLRAAWQKVVDRHAILRTVFIPSTVRPGQHDQLVLANYTSEVDVVYCTDSDLSFTMSEHNSFSYKELRPHQQLTLFVTDSNKTAVKLEVSHALNDGMSTGLMFRDLNLAYIGKLWPTPGPQFGQYVAWLQKQNNDSDINYWQQYIDSTGACSLRFANAVSFCRQQTVIDIELNPYLMDRLPAFCNKIGVTMATFFQAVWGLVLRQYTGSDKTLFGYMTANRDMPLEGVNDMIGPLINVLLCRTEVTRGLRVDDLLHKVQNDFLESLPHQYGLDGAIRKMGIKDSSALFNSVMSLQYYKNDSSESSNTEKQLSSMKNGLVFQEAGGKDPNEYDVSVGVQIINETKDKVKINAQIGYWTDSLSEEDAKKMKSTFEKLALDLASNEAKTF